MSATKWRLIAFALILISIPLAPGAVHNLRELGQILFGIGLGITFARWNA